MDTVHAFRISCGEPPAAGLIHFTIDDNLQDFRILEHRREKPGQKETHVNHYYKSVYGTPLLYSEEHEFLRGVLKRAIYEDNVILKLNTDTYNYFKPKILQQKSFVVGASDIIPGSFTHIKIRIIEI